MVILSRSFSFSLSYQTDISTRSAAGRVAGLLRNVSLTISFLFLFASSANLLVFVLGGCCDGASTGAAGA